MEFDERTDRKRDRRALYRRELPGGGYVEIDVDRVNEGESPRRARVDGMAESSGRSRARISVERRMSEERRFGHEPPVVAEVPGEDAAQLGELFRIAADNAALARALLHWQGRQSREATVPAEEW